MNAMNSTYLKESNFTTRAPHKSSHIFSLIFICVHIFVVALGFFGNILVCAAVSCLRSLRGPYFCLVSSLAVTNLLMVLVAITRVVLTTHLKKYIPFDCHMLSAVAFAVLCVILLHMSALCLERLFAVKCTLRHKILLTRKRLSISIFMLWIVGITGAFGVQYIPRIFSSSERLVYTQFHESFYHCIYIDFHDHTTREIGNIINHPYPLFLDAFYFFVPITVMLVFTNYIYNASCHQGERLEREANIERKVEKRYQLKLATALGINVITFLTFVLPQIVAAIYLHFHSAVLYNSETEKRMQILMLISLTGTCGCLNPIVYVLEIKAIRKQFICCLTPCKRRRGKSTTTREKLAKTELRENKGTSRNPSFKDNGKMKLWSEIDRDLFC